MNIVQVGSNSGKDHVFEFINKHKKDLKLAILIEPIPFLLEKLEKQYESFGNVVVENIAITNEDEKDHMTLYYLENSNYEVSSFSEYHTRRHNPTPLQNPMNSLEVPCCTLNNIMEKYNLNFLDYLFIDAEGLDVYIIGSLNFEKYYFKNIVFEAVHSDGPFEMGENLNKITEYLNNLGYSISKFDSLCLIASK